MLGWLPGSAPYAFSRPVNVLVLGSGGGTEIWSAVSNGATSVTAVELQPDLVRLSKELTAVPPAWTTAEINWHVGEARSFVARTAARFDLITLAQGGGFGLAAAGVHALNEDFRPGRASGQF
jgi:spermidine synthase